MAKKVTLELDNAKVMRQILNNEHKQFVKDVHSYIDTAVERVFNKKTKQCEKHIKKLETLIAKLKRENGNGR